MLKYAIAIFCIISLFVLTQPGFTDSDLVGEAVFEITGGQKGDVTFPHDSHQKILGDCTMCHALFPQKEGVIKEMIAKGSLISKQVMSQCVTCHRTKKKEGLKTGPTSCSKCHKS